MPVILTLFSYLNHALWRQNPTLTHLPSVYPSLLASKEIGAGEDFHPSPSTYLVTVYFSTANTYTSAKITLNINSTGAKDIFYKKAVTSSTNKCEWVANTTITFVYDGTYYRILTMCPDIEANPYKMEFRLQD